MLKKIILLLMAVAVIAMMSATIIEKVYGTETSSAIVYGSWWFIGLWGAISIASLAFLLRNNVLRRPAVMLLHLAFGVILIGAITTYLTAERGTIHLRQNQASNTFSLDNNLTATLPFSVSLKSFSIECYPGTDAPMDYVSTLLITDGKKEQGTDGSEMNISMNHIGSYQGYRFYQHSYDSDGDGAIYGISHDPYGITISYTGYLLLLIGIILTLCSKATRIRSLYREAVGKAVILVLMLVSPAIASAAESHAQAAEPQQPQMVDKQIADKFGHLGVLYNNRICPLNTVAQDFVTKLAGKPSWNGYSANEIFASWMIYYTSWETQKIIRVKSAEVQHIIGIDGQWAAFRDFYDGNTYKLDDKLRSLSPDDASAKAFREADEKVRIIIMFYNGEMTRIFPLATKTADLQWYTPASTQLPKDTPEKEFYFIKHAMDLLVQQMLVNNEAKASEMISKIRLYQKEHVGADIMPSRTAFNIEIAYNTLSSQRWIVFLNLIVCIILCIITLRSKTKTTQNDTNSREDSNGNQHSSLFTPHSSLAYSSFAICYTILIAIYLTMLLLMRWWVSGHVPVSNGYETMIFMAWLFSVLTLCLHRKFSILLAFGPLLAALTMLVAMLAGGTPQMTQLMPVLQSPLLSIHVMVVMASYALFAIDAIIAIIALAGVRISSKPHEVLSAQHNTTQLQTDARQLTALSQLLLYPAVFLLAVGIFVGAVWANVSWGRYWGWDPKETWALITLLVYAIPLHRSLFTANSRAYHIYILAAFLSVLMTYFGVNYLLSGMHSYA